MSTTAVTWWLSGYLALVIALLCLLGWPNTHQRATAWWSDACSHSLRFADACETCKAYDGRAFWECRLDEIARNK